MAANYENEKWVALYQSAILELQQSLLAGRISEARAEITKRIEKLFGMPGLHAEERQAIDDALSGLRSLEREEVRYAEDQQQKLAQEALEKLRSIEPKITQGESG